MGMHLQEAYAPGGMSTVTRARSSLALSCVYGYGAPHPRPRAPGGGRFIGRALHRQRSGIRVVETNIIHNTFSHAHAHPPSPTAHPPTMHTPHTTFFFFDRR